MVGRTLKLTLRLLRVSRLCLGALCALGALACAGRLHGLEILSYNVENLFDDLASGEEYPEFRDPRWAAEWYPAKLAALGRAVLAASRRGPDVLALQEVESERALTALRDRHLAAMGYRYLVFVPQPGAATGVAFLSRVPVRATRAHAVGEFAGSPLRYIVEVQLEVGGRRLYVLNNHWKSKTEGVAETALARRLSAAVLARRVRELLAEDPAADLVALGDFNENLDELAAWAGETGLVDLWSELPETERGSAAFGGRWQTPDHVLLAPGLFDERGFGYGGFQVVRRDFLLERATGFPRRFALGGVSDHLPLLLHLRQP